MTGAGVYGPVAGVVSDYRINGSGVCTYGGCTPGTLHRFSYWMSKDGSQFAGNYVQSGAYNSTCGGRISTSTSPPATCMGGGGIYDGTWFTNLGILTLTQAVQPSNATASASVTGIWFPWGPDAVEYALDGGTATPSFGTTLASANPDQMTLTWSDSSPLGGASFTTGPSDVTGQTTGVTLSGYSSNGVLWCGVDYGPDPFNPAAYNGPDAGTGKFQWNTDPIGSLFPGCGLTDNQWTLWPAVPGGSGSPSASGQLVQTRDAVTGTTDPAELNTVTGSVVFGPTDGGAGAWTAVFGTWSDMTAGTSGAFAWYPNSQDLVFSGNFSLGPPDGGWSAWCGSSTGVEPSPCLQ